VGCISFIEEIDAVRSASSFVCSSMASAIDGYRLARFFGGDLVDKEGGYCSDTRCYDLSTDTHTDPIHELGF
jgi:hypothetical protein